MSLRHCLDSLMRQIQLLDPNCDYGITDVLVRMLSELGYDDTWIAENLAGIEPMVVHCLVEDASSHSGTSEAPRYHFYWDATTRELRSYRFDSPETFDATEEKVAWLNQLRLEPQRNAEAFEAACRDALAGALPPQSTVYRTRLHSDKGIDIYGTVPLENGLGHMYLLCQVKLRHIQGGAEIRTFYGAAQYLLHSSLRHSVNRTPQDLQEFLAQMPTAPTVLLVFCAADYTPEARDECSVLGVRCLDFRWIASQLVSTMRPD